MSTAGKFNKLDRLGDGTYGVVYKAQSRATREVLALKRMNPTAEDEGLSATTIREIALLKELKHPNVVHLKDLMYESPKLTLIFEYCEWDLKKYMDIKKELSVVEIKELLRQLLEGLAYCHQRCVVHRDLKPQNLLLLDLVSTEKTLAPTEEQCKMRTPTELSLKIADFGLARVEFIPVKKFTHEAVTLWYRSPDVIVGSTNYGLPVDMWSVGCIFAEMASGVPLFNAKTDQDQLHRMYKVLGTPNTEIWPSMNGYPNIKTVMGEKLTETTYPPGLQQYASTHRVDRLGQDGMDLLESMLRYEPSRRITAVEALKHPFLADCVGKGNKAHVAATVASASSHTHTTVNGETYVPPTDRLPPNDHHFVGVVGDPSSPSAPTGQQNGTTAPSTSAGASGSSSGSPAADPTRGESSSSRSCCIPFERERESEEARCHWETDATAREASISRIMEMQERLGVTLLVLP